jgi:hypothetical protein
MDCDICRKQLKTSRTYYKHLQSKKHINRVIYVDNENAETIKLLRKLHEADDTDTWHDIIMKYLVVRKLPAKLFLLRFYDVLGNKINNPYNPMRTENMSLVRYVCKVFKRPIPDWINMIEDET